MKRLRKRLRIRRLFLQNGVCSLLLSCLIQKVLHSFKKEYVSFEEAAGRLNAEDIIPYPPGIPMIMAGERITKESVQKLSRLISMKTHVQGNMKIKEKQLLVYIEEEKS